MEQNEGQEQATSMLDDLEHLPIEEVPNVDVAVEEMTSGEAVSTPPPPQEPPPQEPPAPVEPAPAEPAPVAQEPPVEPVPPVEPPPPPSREEELTAQVTALQAELNRVASAFVDAPAPAPSVPPVADENSPPPIHTYIENDEALPGHFESADKLNALFSRVRADAVRDAMQVLPQLTAPIAQEHSRQAVATAMFWQSNFDLVPYEAYVRSVADELQQKYPNESFDRITSAAAQHVRGQLKKQGTPTQPGQPTPSQAAVPQGAQVPKPVPQSSMPPAGGARPAPPKKLEGLDKELAELDAMFSR